MRAAALFALAGVAEIGGAYLVWQAVRSGAAVWVGIAGGAALAAYGVIASLQSDPNFGRILAAYGGVFVFGSFIWGVVFDGFRPDRFDLIGASTCLLGAAIIAGAPR